MDKGSVVGIEIELITILTLHLKRRSVVVVLGKTDGINLVRPIVLYIFIDRPRPSLRNV